MRNTHGSSPSVVHSHNLYFRTVDGGEGKEKLIFEKVGPPFHDSANEARCRAGKLYAKELAKLDFLTEVFLVTLSRDGSEMFGETFKGFGRINTW